MTLIHLAENNMFKVINLFGGPGCCKSTMAAGLFWLMKTRGLSTFLVQEYAQDLILEGRGHVLNEDQPYIFSVQHRRLFQASEKFDFIIMESPLLFGLAYFKDPKGVYEYAKFKMEVLSVFHSYPNINFYIERNPGFRVDLSVRNQGDIEECRAIDAAIQGVLVDNLIPHSVIQAGGMGQIECIYKEVMKSVAN